MTLKATVAQKTYLTPTVLLVRMALEQNLPFRPGQYVVLKIPADGEIIDRPFSIASSPQDPAHIDIVVRLVRGGVASTFLENCRVGEELQLEGPEGSFGARPGAGPVSLIASGSGIAPFRSMLADLLNHGGGNRRVTLYFVVSSLEELFFEQELQELARAHERFRYVPVVSNPHHLSYFRIADLAAADDYYLCGGFHFVRDMAKLLAERGVAGENVHFEEFK